MILVETDLWSKFLSILSNEINSITFTTWFKPLKLYKLDQENNKIIILVPMPSYKKMLVNKWYDTIENALFEISGITYNITFVTEQDINDEINKEEDIEIVDNTTYDEKFETNLKPEFTFDNYVIGETNKFAKTTAMAVASQPGKIYNPLFIYGKCGVGKTHLMHAIGNYIVENTNLKVLYTKSTDFRDDFVVISSGTKEEVITKSQYFRRKYWDVDVLIIDDIQFLVGAEKTQQEFFQIFEELHSKNKQIIISSDTSPDDLKKLEERLKSRLTFSLPVDIFPPDFDLRVRILKDKIKKYSIANLITEEAIEYIANLYDSDVRPLEGSITRLQAYTAMYVPEKIDLKFVMEALGNDSSKNIYSNNSINTIQKAVADYYEITVDTLKGKKRSKNIAYPRMIAMYLSRMMTEESLPRIGLEFGGKDHSTVIHAINKITNDLKDNKKLQEIINEIKTKI